MFKFIWNISLLLTTLIKIYYERNNFILKDLIFITTIPKHV